MSAPPGPLGVKLTTAGAEIGAGGAGAVGAGAAGAGSATTGAGECATGAGDPDGARGGWEKALAPGDCGGGGAPIS